MKTILLLLCFNFFEIIGSTPLPESRRLCEYKSAQVMNFKSQPMSLDFSLTPPLLKSLLKTECDSWKRSSRIRRSSKSAFFKKLTKVALFSLKSVSKGAIQRFKKVLKELPRKTGKLIAKGAKSLVKIIVKTVADGMEEMEESNMYQIEEAVSEELQPLFNLLKYPIRETSEPEQNKFKNSDFGLVIAQLLRNGSVDGLSAMLSEKYDTDMENIHEHDNSMYHHIDPSSIDCDTNIPSISFDLGIFYIDEDTADLKLEMCEDFGYASEETPAYYYHRFPNATFSNTSGTYQIDLEGCAGDENLICFSEAITRSDCSADLTENCEILEKTQNKEIYRELRNGVVVLGSFEHIVVWKNDLATLYGVDPYKLHYISPGAAQRIDFGNHQETRKTNKDQSIIIEIR